MNYPSRKIILVAILTVLIVGGWFYFTKIAPQKWKEPIALKAPEKSIFDEEALKDNDNDGLKNWEEALWQTDPNNPDTDGDGTKDGEEVGLRRDPRKPGPDDGIKAEILDLKQARIETDPTKLNMTDEFARVMLGSFFTSAIQGQTPQNLENALFESVTSAADEIIAADPFSLKDIKISNDTSNQAKANYINNIRTKIDFYSKQAPGSELEIISEALTNENKEKLKELDKFINAYTGFVESLLGVLAPKNYEQAHLDLINATENTKNSLILIQGFFQDPLKALIGIKIYVNQTKKARTILKDLGLLNE